MGITILPKFINWTCLTALGGPAVCALLLGTVSPSNASGISLIRDAEIEHNIHQIAAPIFVAAGLDANAVKIHLVNDQALNAFVAGGQRILQSPTTINRRRGRVFPGHLAKAPGGAARRRRLAPAPQQL